MSREANLKNVEPYGTVLFNMMASIMHAQETYANLEKLELQRAKQEKQNAEIIPA